MIATAYERMKTSPCPAFRWIGQSLAYCDGCGKPFWEHSHEQRLGPGGPFAGRWRNVVIPREQAQAVLDQVMDYGP